MKVGSTPTDKFGGADEGSLPIRNEHERIRSVYSVYAASATYARAHEPSSPGNSVLEADLDAALREKLTQPRLVKIADARILEVGCGSGGQLARLVRIGASARHLTGIDLLDDRVRAASQRVPEANVLQGSALQLPFEDGSFDLVMAFTLFSSVLDDALRREIAHEMVRVLRGGDGSAIVWHDLRYRSLNPNVRPLGIAEVQALFPGFALGLQPAFVLPPLVRRLGRLAPVLYPFLDRVGPLHSHYLGLLTRPR